MSTTTTTTTTTTSVAKLKKKKASYTIPLSSQYELVRDKMSFLSRKEDLFQIIIDRCSAQGKRPYMEDFNLIVRDPMTGILLVIVCDGHGVKTLAEQLVHYFANTILPSLAEAQQQDLCIKEENTEKNALMSQIHKHWLVVEANIKHLVLDIDEYLYHFFDERTNVGGSTLVALAILPWINRMITINVGDSKLIMSDQTGKSHLFSTFSGKPSDEYEKKRIEMAQGWISKDNRVNGILALSRAMGDYNLKTDPHTHQYSPDKGPVSAMPTVEIWTYDYNLKWICLLSDGITDVMSDQQILEFIEKMNKEKVRPAQALVQEAYNRKSGDNLTAIVLYLVPSFHH